MSYPKEQAAAVLSVYKRSPRFRKELNWTPWVESKLLDYMETTQAVPNIINIEKAVEKLDAQGFFEEEAQPMAQQTTQQQSLEQRTQILGDYFRNHFVKDFPSLEPVYDQNGDVICPPSHIVLSQVFPAIPALSHGLIKSKLAELSGRNLLVRKHQVVVVEKQPSAAEKAESERKDKRAKFEQAHAAGLLNDPKYNRNELDDKFDHGRERALPLTEEQRVALNLKNQRINEVIHETMSTINSYTAHSHARTYSRREQLRETFNKFKNQVTDEASALKLQRTIEAEIAKFDGNPSVH